MQLTAPGWRPLLDRPGSAGLFVDFDGTLAPIVDDPSSARIAPGLDGLLEELARSVGVVGVLSGRPVEFLDEIFGPEVVLAGLYGLEIRRLGERHDHDLAGSWREIVDHVCAAATDRGPAGMRVESKGLSLTLHYRGAPDQADAVEAFARGQAARSGLALRSAKMSFELHPPIEADKGTVLRELSEGLETVAFLGDDVGDLPGFDALDALGGSGVNTLRIAVEGADVPAELLRRADLVMAGPDEVVDLLTTLRDALS